MSLGPTFCYMMRQPMTEAEQPGYKYGSITMKARPLSDLPALKALSRLSNPAPGKAYRFTLSRVDKKDDILFNKFSSTEFIAHCICLGTMQVDALDFSTGKSSAVPFKRNFLFAFAHAHIKSFCLNCLIRYKH